MTIKFSYVAGALGLALALAQPGPTAWAHSHGHDHGHGTMTTGSTSPDPASLPLSDHVTADGCWIRQLPKPVPSGGFLVIHNQGSKPVMVKSAASADYAHVMLHQTTEENGLSKMAMIHQLAIPAGQRVELKPGGYHLMLEGPREGLAVGDAVRILFALDDGTAVAATCKVMPARATHGG